MDVGSSSSTSAKSSSSSDSSGVRQYRGTFDCLQSTYKLEGLRGVYAGFGVSLAGICSTISLRQGCMYA